MEFPNFPYPENTTSYPSQSDVLNYLHSYAKHFNLTQHIKFSHLVINVTPTEDERWEIVTQNLLNNSNETNIFDVVFVCNGHYSKYFIPNLPGVEEFKGEVIHSHDFRTAEKFFGKFNDCIYIWRNF